VRRRPPVSALVLTALTVLFAARVVGQALVAFAGVPWLPPMDAWYSGLLPYPVLLPIQLVILGFQAAIDRDVWRGHGVFARPSDRMARRLRWFACAYALAMLVRLLVTGTHLIPVVLHWGLAAYLLTLAGRPRAGRTTSISRARAVTGPPVGGPAPRGR
jgi:hypothetical protein